MGNSGGRSGLFSSYGVTENSRPLTKQLTKGEMEEAEKLQWIMNVTGVSEKEAQRMLFALESYTDGSKTIKDITRQIHNGKRPYEEKMIDSLLNNPNTPIYNGTTFRGLAIRDSDGSSADNTIRTILKSGRWYEPGITSFSSNRRVAMDFTDPLVNGRKGMVGVLIRNIGNRTGVPMSHMSGFFNEREVLYPSSIKNSGFRILGYRRRGNMYYVDVTED